MFHSTMKNFALFAAAVLTANTALAEYPDRPLRMIVPYAAGSGVDVTMRPIADAMGRALGQPNRH